MRTTLEKIEQFKNVDISAKRIDETNINSVFHFHPEMELTYIESSFGRRVVGDCSSIYKPGDLVLLGSNLPHCWINSTNAENQSAKCRAIVIHFGPSLFKIAGLQDIFQVLENSNRGLQLNGNLLSEVESIIKKMPDFTSIDLFKALLDILHLISKSSELQPLATENFRRYSHNAKNEILHRIHQYIAQNLTDDLSVSDAAAISNMSLSAFCHFFKRTTSLSFSEYVNEQRIGYASRLLTESNLNISQICYESGFKTLSYFNRRFKEIKGVPPNEFRSTGN
mgnify:CR=1 FL=1